MQLGSAPLQGDNDHGHASVAAKSNPLNTSNSSHITFTLKTDWGIRTFRNPYYTHIHHNYESPSSRLHRGIRFYTFLSASSRRLSSRSCPSMLAKDKFSSFGDVRCCSWVVCTATSIRVRALMHKLACDSGRLRLRTFLALFALL